ncbi:MAG: hypothetical protein LC804_13030 [Acidobacteria bacterium]|nr:hypothetical protein [Acidobacteriota bacterium]
MRTLIMTVAIAAASHHSLPAATQEGVSWYADHKHPLRRDEPVTLRDGARTFQLASGWWCAVGPASKRARAHESRTTRCRKGADVLEFTVQCDRSRPKDHVQIRFPDSARTVVDFIEVGCRIRPSSR